MENRSKKAWAFPHRSGDVPGGSKAVREPQILIFRGPGEGRGFRGMRISGPLRGRKVRTYGGLEVWGGKSNKVESNSPAGPTLGTPYATSAVADL